MRITFNSASMKEIEQVQLPSPRSAVHNDMNIINKVSDHIILI